MASPYRPTLTPQRPSPSYRLSTIEEPPRSATPSSPPPSPTPSPSPHPFSPFYTHGTTRHSLEVHKSGSKPSMIVYEMDVEACSPAPSLEFAPRQDCAMWPGKQAIVAKQKKALHRGGCHPLARLSGRTKLAVKILIALLVVSAAVGIGVGVSKAVGGGVWKEGGGTTPIGG